MRDPQDPLGGCNDSPAAVDVAAAVSVAVAAVVAVAGDRGECTACTACTASTRTMMCTGALGCWREEW